MTRRKSAVRTAWVTPLEAAELTGIYSQRTFTRWAAEEKIPARQLPNGRWLILRSEVEALLALPMSADTDETGSKRMTPVLEGQQELALGRVS